MQIIPSIKFPIVSFFEFFLKFFPKQYINYYFHKLENNGELATINKYSILRKSLRTFNSFNRYDLKNNLAELCNFVILNEKKETKRKLKIAVPLMIPPRISHLHLFIFLKAINFSQIGVEIIFILEDNRYLRQARLGKNDRDWITPNSALFNFIRSFKFCIDKYNEYFANHSNVARISIDDFSIFYESQIFHLNQTAENIEKFNNLMDSVNINLTFRLSLRKLALFRFEKQRTAYDVLSFTESFFNTIVFSNPDYIITGYDRKHFNKHLINICYKSGIFESLPKILSWDKVPDKLGNYKWLIDSDTLYYPFESIYTKNNGTKFDNWTRNAIINNLPDKLKSYDFLKSLKTDFQYPTLREVCQEIFELNSKYIESIILFGSNINLADESLLPFKIYSIKRNPIEGDIDLLFILKAKDNSVYENIENKIRSFGDIIQHPDFYSRRTKFERIFEIITIPTSSKYFIKENLGILTGLSVFSTHRFLTLAGKDPSTSNFPMIPINDYHSRIHIYKHAHNGLKDFQTRLWPFISRNTFPFDFLRILRFLLIDALWAKSGIWYFSWIEIVKNLSILKLSKNSEEYISKIVKNYNLNYNLTMIEREKIEIIPTSEDVKYLYRIICDIDIKLR